MLGSPRLVRILTAVAGGALIATGLVAGAPALASATTASVTILLRAPDQAGLNRLALAQGLSHAQRVAALTPLLPSAATHRQVSAVLRSEGLTVTGQTAWTITAQAPTPVVASAFGAHAKSAPTLPAVPSRLASLTAGVLPSTGGPPLFAPRDQCSLRCHTGADFRNAYTAPNVAPSTGGVHGALTIATLQFAGWNPSDLSDYAAARHLPDPVATGQYTQIPVGESKVPAASTSEHEADEEVDLDEETILATDPAANERAYFSPISSNNMSGYARDLGQVIADVTQGPHAIDGGDPHIAALSTSWGTCEDEFEFGFPADTITAVENMLKSLTAAGVTVFAASGDDGVYDCGDSVASTKIAVDYPASSPEVVGVGGTRLQAIGPRAANTGTNWTDSAWRCSSATTCQGQAANDTGGSGGGESNLFRMPAYQSAGLGHQRFVTSTGKKGGFATQPHRLVPDIADDGDPASGFGVLTSDPSDVPSCAPPHQHTCTPQTFAIGGTSLSAPAAAALFTDMLGAHNRTSGVGDIHDALYSAYAAHRGVFRDVTTGVNGFQADVDRHARHASYEIPVSAQKGYDTLTGVGAPLWPRLAPFLFTSTPPTPTASIKLASRHSVKHATRVTAGWGTTQALHGGSLAGSASVTITRDGANKPIYHSGSTAATGSHTFHAHHGASYLLTVIDRDLAGHLSHRVTKHLAVPYDDGSFTFHGTWTRVNARTDFAGSHETTSARGAFAKATARGRRFVLEVRTGPMFGKLAIRHGGTTIGTYDLYSPSVHHLRIALFGTPKTTVATRTFTFHYTGHKNPHSSAATINLDALYAFD